MAESEHPVAGAHNMLDRAEPTLPFDWYYSSDQYQRELQGVWCRQWLYLCRADSLAKPRSFRTMSIGKQEVLVARADSGKLAAWYNSCRHRGARLVSDGQGCLKANSVSCPYHRWRYSLEDGSLLRTSSLFEPEGFDKADYGLFPAVVVEWRGFVFVNLDAGASFDATRMLNGEDRLIENYPLKRMVLGHTWTKTIECNWKTFWDNYGECLHCPGVHPELVKIQPIFKRGLLSPGDPPDWRDHVNDPDPRHRGGLREGAETWSKDGSAQGYSRREGLSEADIARGVSYATAYPGMYFACFPDHARTVRILPTGPEQVEMQVEWLVHVEALEDPAYDMGNIIEFAQTVLLEDSAVCELAQRGMHALPLKKGVLMPEEYELRFFRDWLLNALEQGESNEI